LVFPLWPALTHFIPESCDPMISFAVDRQGLGYPVVKVATYARHLPLEILVFKINVAERDLLHIAVVVIAKDPGLSPEVVPVAILAS